MSDYLPPMSNDEIERALLNPSHDPEAYALALRHQEAFARDYEDAAMFAFQSVASRPGGIKAVFDNGAPALPDNWLEEMTRTTQALLVDLPSVSSAPLFGGSYAASNAHDEYAEQRLRSDWPTYKPYRLKPHLIRIPYDNEHPRRYSGNSHQRRKQRRAQRSHR